MHPIKNLMTMYGHKIQELMKSKSFQIHTWPMIVKLIFSTYLTDLQMLCDIEI